MKTVAGKVFLRTNKVSNDRSIDDAYSPYDPLEQSRECQTKAAEEVECADEGDSRPRRRSCPTHEERRERRQAEEERRDSEGGTTRQLHQYCGKGSRDVGRATGFHSASQRLPSLQFLQVGDRVARTAQR
jgi:hypothetical protein